MMESKSIKINNEIKEMAMGLYAAFSPEDDLNLYQCFDLAIKLKQFEMIERQLDKIIETHQTVLKN